MKELALEINNVSFSYKDSGQILKNINLVLEKTYSMGIAGANGSGKTTLFYLITGILKPESGFVNIYGKPVKHGKFNPDCGFVFQNPDNQLFSPTVYDDLAFGLYNLGFSDIEIKQRISSALEKLSLEHLKTRAPGHLSGGEKRLMSLLSVLVMEPGLLILDEPTSGLDMKYRRVLINLLNSIKVPKIVSSHDLEFILETCDYSALLHNGKIFGKGKTGELFSNRGLMEECHQEIPYSLKNIQI